MALKNGSGGFVLSERLRNMRFMRERGNSDQTASKEREQREREKAAQWTLETDGAGGSKSDADEDDWAPLVVFEDTFVTATPDVYVGRHSFGKFNRAVERRNRPTDAGAEPDVDVDADANVDVDAEADADAAERPSRAAKPKRKEEGAPPAAAPARLGAARGRRREKLEADLDLARGDVAKTEDGEVAMEDATVSGAEREPLASVRKAGHAFKLGKRPHGPHSRPRKKAKSNHKREPRSSR